LLNNQHLAVALLLQVAVAVVLVVLQVLQVLMVHQVEVEVEAEAIPETKNGGRSPALEVAQVPVVIATMIIPTLTLFLSQTALCQPPLIGSLLELSIQLRTKANAVPATLSPLLALSRLTTTSMETRTCMFLLNK